ncbi:hypothetical protein BDF21DRAFT_395299 [Thamnidium elegans]|nr:hypothetical protein BDF21DRAFT_395299 [Thamnidium elegans]
MDLSILHWSIDCTNVKAIFGPVGDRNCGYRAITYFHYGNEDRYRDVKREMLVVFEANKDTYLKIFSFDIVSLERIIKSDIYEYRTSMFIWFNYHDFVQVVADTYNIPVCTYHNARNKRCLYEPLTILPLKVLVKSKIKVRPYHLQNIELTRIEVIIRFIWLQSTI